MELELRYAHRKTHLTAVAVVVFVVHIYLNHVQGIPIENEKYTDCSTFSYIKALDRLLKCP